MVHIYFVLHAAPDSPPVKERRILPEENVTSALVCTLENAWHPDTNATHQHVTRYVPLPD